MPRPRTKKNRWDHPNYRWAYCYDRDGVVYTCVHSVRCSTPFIWKTTSKNAAMELLNRRISEVYELQQKQPITIAEAKEIYLNERRMQISHFNYLQNKLALEIIPNCDWSESNVIRSEVLKKTAGYSSYTVSYRVGYIRAFFNWAVENEYITKNPIPQSMNVKKKRNAQRSSFSESEMEKILELSKSKGIYDLVFFLSKTGLRVAEAINIRHTDIDDEFIQIKGKGDYIRHIPYKILGVTDIVDKMKATHGRYFKQSYQNYKVILEQILLSAKIPAEKRKYHSIRKYAENYLIKIKKLDMRIVAELLGHTIAIQQKHYYEIMSRDELKNSLEEHLRE